MPDPLAMLELDHRHVEALFEQLAGSEEGPERDRLVRDLEESLVAHMTFEERDLSARGGGDRRRVGAGGRNRAPPGARVWPTSASWCRARLRGAAVESLKGGITHHVEEEEGEMFPKLRSGTDSDTQQRLTAEFIAAKRAAGLPVVPPEATKEQLVEMARDLDIDGRSTMDLEQLIGAVTQTT